MKDELLVVTSTTRRQTRFCHPLNELNLFNKGLLGGITDAIGLTDYKGQAKREAEAKDSAAKARAASTALGQQGIDMTREQLDFQKEQFDRWKAIYGTIEEQVGAFAREQTGALQTAQALEAQQTEFQRAGENVSQQFAQRGISGSGLEAAAITSLTGINAGQRASIRANQDQVALQTKMNVLGLGLGQGGQLLSTQAQLAQGGANNLVSLAGQQIGSANNLNSLQGQFAGFQNQARMNMISTIGGFAGTRA